MSRHPCSRPCTAALVAAVLLGQAVGARAQAGGASGAQAADLLAKKVANPLASLISVPVQVNQDDGYGPRDTGRWSLNLQPVVPIGLGADSHWRILSRTVVPIVWTEGGTPGGEVSGLGDLTESLFLTPVRPGARGWTLGLGPVLQFPTGTEDRLTTNRWGLGPTTIAVRQSGPWTYGALVNHVWSVAGDGPDLSTTFAQPFVNFVTPSHTTLALNTEASRDWERETWSVPLNLMITQLLKVGHQPMSVFVGARWWAESAESGAEGLGLRFGTTLLFPKGRPHPPAPAGLETAR